MLSVELEKAQMELEKRATALQVEAGRLVELRAELAKVLTDMDVQSTELPSLECQELDALRLLAVEPCPEKLVSKQNAVVDIHASID